MIHILFGKSGSGKSYVSRVLTEHYGFHSFDADVILTDTMKAFIRDERIFSRTMMDDYVVRLSKRMHSFPHQSKPVFIAQALYGNQERFDLLKQFPDAQFILVHADDDVCYSRVQRRRDWVSVEYAKKMLPYFEEPAHAYIQLDNSVEGRDHIIQQLNRLTFY